jgi:ABC-type multidrug transport system ATPase subunit
MVTNEFASRSLTCAASELVPSTFNPLLAMSPPVGYGGVQICPYPTGPLYSAGNYDVDAAESPWASFGYLCVFFGVFSLMAIRAISNIDHSKLAARLPPLIRNLDHQAASSKAKTPALVEIPVPETEVIQVAPSRKALSVYLSFTDLCYSVMVPPPSDSQASNDALVEKKILNDVYGVSGPGNMVALMGASGAGKTTLLDVLAGRKSGGVMTGNITINGKPKNPTYFHRFAGYVEQFDSHLPEATVRETVAFSAAMRLEPTVTEVERAERVEEVLSILNLQDIADERIGSVDMGGWSAELRKKVTIAVELVMNPGILFLDEPTTGLDASAALSVMLTVRRLANDISVICTIHQPSSTVLALFDSLLLLEPGGRVAYYGPMMELPVYFAEAGMGHCPSDQNIADFALKVLARRAGEERQNADLKRGSDLFLAHPRYQGLVADVARVNAPPANASSLAFDTIMTASIGTQFQSNMLRSLQSLFRNKGFLIARLSGAIQFAWILGTLDYQMTQDVRDAANRIAVLFFSLTTPVFSSGAGIPVVQSKRVMLARERASQMYYSSIFYLTEFLADIPLTIIQSFFYAVPVYLLAGFRLDDASSHFWIFYACIFCLYMNGFALANFTGYLLETSAGANLMMTSFLSLNLLFVGFIINVNSIPSGWIWAHWLNVFRYPLFAMVPNEMVLFIEKNITFE